MNFAEVEEFVRKHWPAALMVTIIVTPGVWAIASTLYSGRITALEAKVQELSERVAVLDQLAQRSREKLAASKSSYTAKELYTSSSSVETKVEPK